MFAQYFPHPMRRRVAQLAQHTGLLLRSTHLLQNALFSCGPSKTSRSAGHSAQLCLFVKMRRLTSPEAGQSVFLQELIDAISAASVRSEERQRLQYFFLYFTPTCLQGTSSLFLWMQVRQVAVAGVQGQVERENQPGLKWRFVHTFPDILQEVLVQVCSNDCLVTMAIQSIESMEQEAKVFPSQG